jgi:glycerol uptake facilitator-like aquaporin
MSEPLLGEDDEKLDRSHMTSTTFDEDGRVMRYKSFVRATYGELMGTFLFFLPVFGGMANAYQSNWDPVVTNLILALITALNGVAIIFCFSSLSGSQFNPAISFALWLIGKQSNRRFLAFTVAQIVGGILVMACICGAFHNADRNMFKSMALTAPNSSTKANIFFTEFLVSFLLTFVAFAMAFEEQVSNQRASAVSLKAMQDDTLIMYSSTPQSKSGFAPFAIGFVLFGIVMFGGGSGVGLNPVRMLSPAFFANEWQDMYLYLLGEYMGAGVAAMIVHYGPQTGRRDMQDLQESIREVPKELKQRIKFLGDKVTRR